MDIEHIFILKEVLYVTREDENKGYEKRKRVFKNGSKTRNRESNNRQNNLDESRKRFVPLTTKRIELWNLKCRLWKMDQRIIKTQS